MNTKINTNKPRKAFVVLILQVIAWLLILVSLFQDYGANNDAAGAGMVSGLSILFVVFPCMAFVFFTSFNFLKRGMPTRFRLFGVFNYIGLFVVFFAIN